VGSFCSSSSGTQSHFFRRRPLEILIPFHDVFKRYRRRLSIPSMDSLKQNLQRSIDEMKLDGNPECACSGPKGVPL
jgi:hypothetical protein